MAKREWGVESRGNDDDETPGEEHKVQIENSYFEKLKGRLSRQRQPVFGKDMAEAEKLKGRLNAGIKPGTAPTAVGLGEAEKPKGPGFVIYGDDGRPIV